MLTTTDPSSEQGKQSIPEVVMDVTNSDPSSKVLTKGEVRSSGVVGVKPSIDAIKIEPDRKDLNRQEPRSNRDSDNRRDEKVLSERNLAATTAGNSKPKIVVDREKTCPFLLRMFCQEGAHHGLDKYTIEQQPTQHEVQIYTWKDATLKELGNLIKQVKPEVQRPNARLSFKLVYQDQLRNCYMFKDLGMVMNSRNTVEEDTNLDDARFVIGDFLDVAVFYGPASNSRPAERRASGGGGNGGQSVLRERERVGASRVFRGRDRDERRGRERNGRGLDRDDRRYRERDAERRRDRGPSFRDRRR